MGQEISKALYLLVQEEQKSNGSKRSELLSVGKKMILSGIQPSNHLHLGNYLGAIKQWLKLQQDYDCFFLMVDLHALTVPQVPEVFRESSYRGVATYLACGLDPHSSSFILQSQVPEHTQLAWILICSSHMGELGRMTQFKDKSQKSVKGEIGVGLYIYPCLMAADILLYQPDFVPVGDDQKQHVELTRNLAQRLNGRFGVEIFKVPKPLIPTRGGRIMDFQMPSAKMSKSAQNHKGVIFLSDDDKQILKKIRSAVTDSGTDYNSLDTASPGLINICETYATLTDQSIDDVDQYFSGKKYGLIKNELAEVIIETIRPIREKTNRYMCELSFLDNILASGAQKAKERARNPLKKVYQTLGLVTN